MQVKGMAFIARQASVAAKFGNEKLEQVMDAAPQVRALMTSSGNFYPSRLYEYEHYTAFNQSVCDILYNGDEKAYIEMGEESAEAALQSVHKIFIMNKDVRSFLRSLPVIYNAYYVDMGAAKIDIDDKINSAVTEIHVPGRPHRSLCQIISGYVKRGLALCGARDITLNETACQCRGDDACRMEIRWS